MTVSGSAQHGHGGRWYKPQSIWRSVRLRPKIIWATVFAIVTLLALPHAWPAAVRGSLAWSVGGLVYLAGSFRVMLSCGADMIRSRAARQDDSAIVILAIILLAIAASFLAIAGLITTAKAAQSGLLRAGLLTLAGSTIVVSWLVTQVAFTLHYAHEHYAPHDHGTAGGLIFPGDTRPDYWDFFYFSTSIGATSQTSDVEISSKPIRHIVTVHAIVSFFFNTMVLALTINLAASLF